MGNSHAVRALCTFLDAKGDAQFVNGIGLTGRLPLVIAAAHGNSSTCVHLLSVGADPLKADGSGCTAVWAAMGSGVEERAVFMMAQLISMKRLGSAAVVEFLQQPGPAGQTLAQCAVQRRYYAVIAHLRTLGVQMNLIHTGETPLKMACQVGSCAATSQLHTVCVPFKLTLY